ncbi:MAG: hypothetical protein AB1696_28935 [Planctomycetota bacterium]
MSESLAFKPNFEEAKKHWEAFWNQEALDRPCTAITCHRTGAPPARPLPYMSGHDGNFGPVIEAVLHNAETTWWGGDAMPHYTPSFGPDQFAAWLGADLEWSKDSQSTNWVVPFVEDWKKALPLRLDAQNKWWTRMLDFVAALGKAAAGKMLIAHLDLHSNMDALSAIRTPSRLCMDLYDVPELIDRAMADVRAMYPAVYDAVYEAGGMARHGTCGWVPAYHHGKTNTIQCDFAALCGPEHFRRWILPALDEEAAFLEHCVYHYDGPECLVHLDDICSIKGLDAIQWTPGARNKSFIEWMDLLKEIQSKGKGVYVPCNTTDIKTYHKELKPNMVFYICSARNEEEAQRTLDWLVENT